ncbi:hypothetical protein BKI52_36540 [marine bacterium AO1-C]|nr:hypothetical protein BKI52_36540 [marine bacterium AO1-C]
MSYLKQLIFSLLITFACYAQAKAQLSTLKFADKLTKRHTKITGTRASIVLPSGFKKSREFAGITNKKSIQMIFIEITGQPYNRAQALENLRKEYKKQRSKIKKLVKLKNASYAPVVMQMKNSNGVKLIQVIMGDKQSMLSVTASYDSKKEKQQVLQCLRSLYFDGKAVASKDMGAKFKLDISNTQLKAMGSTGYTFYYQTKKFNKVDKAQRTQIIITQALASIYKGQSFQKLCEERAISKKQKIISRKAVQTKIGKGYWIVTKSKIDGGIICHLTTGNARFVLIIKVGTFKPEKQAIAHFEDLLLKRLSSR